MTHGASTLGALARASRAVGGALGRQRLSILIFHRVLPQPDPLFPNEVDARRFDRMMAMVAAGFNVLPLQQAAAALARSELPAPALAITFDDGYADNHAIALPILRRHGLSATVFVSTGFLDGGRMWNDTVIECIRRCAHERLDLGPVGIDIEFSLDSMAARRRAIEQVLRLIKYKTPAEREPLLGTLHRICGRPALPDDLMMSREQVKALHRAGVTIGAHTVHHPILCTLDDAAARTEIETSRNELRCLIDDPIETFAYPNGRPGKDYDERHVAIARGLGFKAAVSTAKGVSVPGDDVLQLKRYTPWQPNRGRWLASLALQHARG